MGPSPKDGAGKHHNTVGTAGKHCSAVGGAGECLGAKGGAGEYHSAKGGAREHWCAKCGVGNASVLQVSVATRSQNLQEWIALRINTYKGCNNTRGQRKKPTTPRPDSDPKCAGECQRGLYGKDWQTKIMYI